MPRSVTDWLSEERLRDLLEACSRCRVGVVGDLALDGYWTADMTRSLLSRETPHFPRPIVDERYAPGAGGNVAQNLSALGVAEVVVFSVLGDDWRGEILQHEMKIRDINVGRLVVSDQRRTTAYIKPLLTGYESQQEGPRLDFENTEPLHEALEAALVQSIRESLAELDGVIVADQFESQGVVTERVRADLIGLAAAHPDKVFVADSRKRIGHFEHMVLKPNWFEAATAVYPNRDPRSVDREALGEVASTLAARTGRPVIVTLSEEGALVRAGDTSTIVPAAPVTPPLDPVGAGDTFVAALTTAMAAGASPVEAVALANLAAAVIVEKLNETGTATPEEILARYHLAQER
ncbi:MAG: bifunctional heptose 7-phosphate kinase/heptose 1-phosphate adenyltransferase [Anaerolineae bacterium]